MSNLSDGSLTVGRVSVQRSPADFGERLPRPTPATRRILGLDLGTNCGVAVCDAHGPQPWPIYLGQWDLSLSGYESNPLRLLRLEQFLDVAAPDLIAYEDVKFTPSGDIAAMGKINIRAVLARVSSAAELLGAFKIVLTRWAEMHNVPAMGVGIGTIKRFMTGRGNANKVDMIEAVNARMGVALNTEDYEATGEDNMADAAGVCLMALENFSEWIKREN